MLPGVAAVIGAVHSRLIGGEVGPPRLRRTHAQARRCMGDGCDLPLLPGAPPVGGGHDAHPVVHSHVELAVLVIVFLHIPFLLSCAHP